MARDAVLNFGFIAAATKDEVAYSNVLDFGAIDSRSSTQTHRTGELDEVSVVFNCPLALASIDYIDGMKLQHSDAEDTGFVDLLTGEACLAGAGPGKLCIYHFPKRHKRYVRAALTPRSSGVFSAREVEVYLDFGPEVLD